MNTFLGNAFLPAAAAMASALPKEISWCPVSPSDEDFTSFPYHAHLLRLLKEKFRHPHFRPLQLPAIVCDVQGHDLFARLKTGSGKTLCYLLPAAYATETKGPTLTVVFTPLLSLMEQHFNTVVEKYGFRAARLGSGGEDNAPLFLNPCLTPHDEDFPQFLFLTPEKFHTNGEVRQRLVDLNKGGFLRRFVIDEAHVLTQCDSWRPHYRELKALRIDFPKVPITALTASASLSTIGDILECLGIKGQNCKVVKGDVDRRNLIYEVRPIPPTARSHNRLRIIDDIIQERPDASGIIYCTTTAEVDRVYAYLHSRNRSVDKYYSGRDKKTMSHTGKKLAHEKWMSGECLIMVATSAFSLGIDKPNVRFVIHTGLPQNMEQYIQETGRAGRDNEPAACIMLYNAYSWQRTYQLMAWNTQLSEAASKKLDYMTRYGFDNTRCRRKWILPVFDDDIKSSCSPTGCDACDVCLKWPHTLHILDPDDLDQDLDSIRPDLGWTSGHLKNMTECATLVLEILSEIKGSMTFFRPTLRQLGSILHGSHRHLSKEIISKLSGQSVGLLYGKGKEEIGTLDDSHWFCASLVLFGLIKEVPVKRDSSWGYVFYVEVDVDKSKAVLDGSQKIMLHWPPPYRWVAKKAKPNRCRTHPLTPTLVPSSSPSPSALALSIPSTPPISSPPYLRGGLKHDPIQLLSEEEEDYDSRHDQDISLDEQRASRQRDTMGFMKIFEAELHFSDASSITDEDVGGGGEVGARKHKMAEGYTTDDEMREGSEADDEEMSESDDVEEEADGNEDGWHGDENEESGGERVVGRDGATQENAIEVSSDEEETDEEATPHWIIGRKGIQAKVAQNQNRYPRTRGDTKRRLQTKEEMLFIL